MFDGTSWGTDTVIDATSGRSESDPAAVAFNTALHVFWGDSTGQLRMKATSSGTNWGPIHIVDGAGATSPGAHTGDIISGLPSVIVDNESPPNLHVFYWDWSAFSLLEAWSSTGADGSWQYSVVAAAGTGAYVASPVLVNGGATLEVYYVDPVYHTLREAQKKSLTGSTWNLSTIDGAGGKCSGAVPSDELFGAVATSSGNPKVFYIDSQISTLRVATYQ
jgi:hypothetical protein